MTRWSVGVGLTAMLALLGFTVPASAVELAGTLNIGGGVTVSANTIDWLPAGTGTGTFNIPQPASGYFLDPGNGGGAIYQPFPFATGVSLDLAQSPTAGFTTAPVNTAISVANFLSGFTSSNPEYSDLNFTLTFIPNASSSTGACVGAIGIGQSCNLGAFQITQSTANSLTVSLNMDGIFNDPSLGISSLMATGAYSTQGLLLGSHGNTIGTVPQLLAEINSGGSISASYSATFNSTGAPVPEPATLFLLGTGLLGVGFGSKRRLSRKPSA